MVLSSRLGWVWAALALEDPGPEPSSAPLPLWWRWPMLWPWAGLLASDASGLRPCG